MTGMMGMIAGIVMAALGIVERDLGAYRSSRIGSDSYFGGSSSG